MNNQTVPLLEVPVNTKVKIKKIMIDGPIKRRLLDLGFIEDTIIEVLQKSPFGDPVAYSIRGTIIALRNEITSNILIEKIN